MMKMVVWSGAGGAGGIWLRIDRLRIGRSRSVCRYRWAAGKVFSVTLSVRSSRCTIITVSSVQHVRKGRSTPPPRGKGRLCALDLPHPPGARLERLFDH